MAILREQAQFDTSGVRGFDRGGMDWALQSVTYTLKIYDTSDAKVAEIAGDLENTTLVNLKFKTNRKGGCERFSFELAEPYTTATIAYNYKVEIYLFNHFSPWFTGYIEEVPDTAGTDSIQHYTGYGYFEKFNKKLVNDSFTAQEISVIATSVLDDDIIANYPAITKNTDKIEATGYTLAGTLQFERQFAKDVFTLLADIANDYEFGVDQDAEFFFRAIDATILERFWVGTHITDFTPEKDYNQIVNRWYIYAPPFSDGSNYQIMVENAASQSSYGLAEDFIDAPAIISIYSSTNLASGKTPITSPAAGTPANMTDGDNSTLWESGADQTIGHYIKIDLGATFDQVAKVVLDSIHSTAQEYHATLFKIETSTDDITYTEVFTCSSDPGWKPTVTFQPVAARYILITLTAAVAVHWKVGEAEVYELDTADLERWGAQVLADSKDPILRAVVTIRGIDKVISKRPIVAPIHPTGKCRITDRDGTTTHDYAIISCEYILSSSGFDLHMELGHTKPEISDQMRLLKRQIAENRLLGIRRGDNIASGTGFNQGSIDQTIIKTDSIETPHLRGNKISLHGGLVELGQDVMSAGGHGLIVKDANGYYRFEAGKLNGDYGMTIRDALNNVMISQGSFLFGNAKFRAYQTGAYLMDNAINKTTGHSVIILDTEDYDPGSNFNISSWVTGTCTSTEAGYLNDSGGAFVSGMVNCVVHNTTDDTYATVQAFSSSTRLFLFNDIFVQNEEYEIVYSRFIAPVAGDYVFAGCVAYGISNAHNDEYFLAMLVKNGSVYTTNSQDSSGNADSRRFSVPVMDVIPLAVDDYIQLAGNHDHATGVNVTGTGIEGGRTTYLCGHLFSAA